MLLGERIGGKPRFRPRRYAAESYLILPDIIAPPTAAWRGAVPLLLEFSKEVFQEGGGCNKGRGLGAFSSIARRHWRNSRTFPSTSAGLPGLREAVQNAECDGHVGDAGHDGNLLVVPLMSVEVDPFNAPGGDSAWHPRRCPGDRRRFLRSKQATPGGSPPSRRTHNPPSGVGCAKRFGLRHGSSLWNGVSEPPQSRQPEKGRMVHTRS